MYLIQNLLNLIDGLLYLIASYGLLYLIDVLLNLIDGLLYLIDGL